MFTCHSCMRRIICTVLGDSVLYTVGRGTAVNPKYTTLAVHRSYSATLQPKNRGRKPWEKDVDEQPRRFLKRNPSQAAIQKELSYLEDPLKLANHVLDLLSQSRYEEAKSLVHTASKTFRCTVSWNHLINWLLSKGNVKSAVSMYNDMKKRAQAPDAHTYTILFTGLANNSHYSESLSRALSIYHSMDADNSPVKPNVIHTNAVLKVCARAKNMDALYGIVAKLQRRGLRAPNNLTYTTILNAIRQQMAEVTSGMEDGAERRAIYQKAIMETRKLWVEIKDRWLQGDIWIDEETTCSMGRILLVGDARDIDDVFSLVEQTMNIPRLIPKFGTDVKDQVVPELGNNVDIETESTFHTGQEVINEEGQRVANQDGPREAVPHDEFSVTVRPDHLMKHSEAYPKPGRNSLSLVLEALKEVKLSRPVFAYWDFFTNVCGVVPDSNNFHTYLQNLRIRRASSDAVDVVQKMPKEMLQMKTFRITMATCARDKNNPNSFSNAGKLLDLMQQNLSKLDLVALHKYMEVALYGAIQPGEGPKTKDQLEFARGRQILRALQRLNPCITNVRSSLAYSERPHTQYVSKSEPAEGYVAAVALVREMISAYDKLINRGMVPQEMNAHLRSERSRLATFVTRYTAGARKPSSTDEVAAKQKAQPSRVAPKERTIPKKKMAPKVTIETTEPIETKSIALA